MWPLFILCLAVASAHVILDGPCPSDIRPVADFDMSSFQGIWYQIKKLPIYNEAHADCGVLDYTLVHDVLKVNHSHVFDGYQKAIWGVLSKADDARGSGKLFLSTVVNDNVRINDYWVVSTDYKNYAINYSCKYFPNVNQHLMLLWAISRTKTLSPSSAVIVEDFLNDHYWDFPADKFIIVDHSDETCKFKKSVTYKVPFDE